MLCFLPPMPADFDGVPPARPSRSGETRAIVLVVLVVLCALLAPFGTMSRQRAGKVAQVATAPDAREGTGRVAPSSQPLKGGLYPAARALPTSE